MPDIAPETIMQAHSVAAERCLQVLGSAEADRHERLVAYGNYVLASALASEDIESSVKDGLVNAGATVEQGEKAAALLDTRMRRLIFSLSYAGADEVPGIRRRRKSVILDEERFIEGILSAED